MRVSGAVQTFSCGVPAVRPFWCACEMLEDEEEGGAED